MAHLVESMAYVGTKPWHGLGQELPSSQSVDEWMIHAGMNWEIKDSPVRFISGDSSYLGSLHGFEEHKVLYRSDTQAPLSVVGRRYQVVQPREILEFYRDLTEQSGFELETAGVLKGGRKLWALAKTGQSTSLAGGDTTKGYVLLATACDGTMATTAQFTSVRVVCNNTLSVALDNGSQAIKVPHRSQFDAQAVKKALGISVSAWDEFMYRMKHLSERKVSDKEASHFVQQLLAPDKNQDEDGEYRFSTQTQRNMGKVIDLFNGQGMGANLASAQGTAYGLLNAVTQYVDHEQRARSRDNRLNSAWFGAGANLKQRALDTSLKLVA